MRSAGEVYRLLAPAVLGYLRTQGVPDPEDVTGEVFLQVARDLHRFKGDDDALRRWVFTIAHHRMVDSHRRRARRPAVVDLEVPEQAAPPPEQPLDPDLVAASVAGGTGLSFAGGLPGSAQHVAHDALGAVGINVPEGSSGKAPCVPAPGVPAGDGCAPGTVRLPKSGSGKAGRKTGTTGDVTTTVLRVDQTPPPGAVITDDGTSSSSSAGTAG